MHESSAHMRAPAERVRNARGSALQRSVRHSRAALASPAPAPLQRAALTLALRDPPLPPPRDPAVGGRIPLSASPGGLRDGRGALRHARTQALGTPDFAMGLRCTKDQHPSRESQSQPVRTTCALEGALRAERMLRAARLHTAWTRSDACLRHAPSRAEAHAAVARFLHLPIHRTALGLRASVMRGRGQHSRVEACELLLQRKISKFEFQTENTRLVLKTFWYKMHCALKTARRMWRRKLLLLLRRRTPPPRRRRYAGGGVVKKEDSGLFRGKMRKETFLFSVTSHCDAFSCKPREEVMQAN